VFDRPTIYVDFDDVLCHTARALTDLLKRKFGKQVDFETIATFSLGEAFGISAMELDELMADAHELDELLAMEPIDGARSHLRRLAGEGVGIHVVTGRPPHSREASLVWLEQNAMPYDELIFVDKYGRAADEPDAVPLDELDERPYALVLEDSGEMALYMAERAGRTVALLDRPWNRHLAAGQYGSGTVVRCADWDAAIPLLGDG